MLTNLFPDTMLFLCLKWSLSCYKRFIHSFVVCDYFKIWGLGSKVQTVNLREIS